MNLKIDECVDVIDGRVITYIFLHLHFLHQVSSFRIGVNPQLTACIRLLSSSMLHLQPRDGGQMHAYR